VVDPSTLVAAGLVRAGRPVKLLANGALTKNLTVKVDKASEAARAAVTAAGGTVETPEAAASQEG
jgi:large subunit ribosomal protein L15